MPDIHPTAIVDSKAEIADDVVIGQYCTIEGDVRIACGCKLVANVYLRGPLKIGVNNTFYPFSCLGFPPQDRKFSPQDITGGITIGDDNIIRESVTIHGATGDSPTKIGNGNFLMVGSHIGHDSVVGNQCTLANAAEIAGHVHLQDKVNLGGHAVIQQFCRVGRLAMISGTMGINRDLPPFCLVYNTRYVSSLNIIGLRRAGYSESIPALKKAFNIFFKQKLSNPHAVEIVEKELSHEPLCLEMAEFVKQSKVGICTYSR